MGSSKKGGRKKAEEEQSPDLAVVHVVGGRGRGPCGKVRGSGGLGCGRIHLATKKKPGGDVGGDVPLMSLERYSLGGEEPFWVTRLPGPPPASLLPLPSTPPSPPWPHPRPARPPSTSPRGQAPGAFTPQPLGGQPIVPLPRVLPHSRSPLARPHPRRCAFLCQGPQRWGWNELLSERTAVDRGLERGGS